MKKIEIDDELYQYIASRTQSIGESASDILRRLLRLPANPQPFALVQENMAGEPKAAPKRKEKGSVEQAVLRLEKLLKSEHFIKANKNVSRFLMILNALYRANPESFAKAVENIHGSERIYFAKNEAEILANGSSVKAKQIPESPYWVITNNNSMRKGIILSNVMTAMKIPHHLIERIQTMFA